MIANQDKISNKFLKHNGIVLYRLKESYNTIKYQYGSQCMYVKVNRPDGEPEVIYSLGKTNNIFLIVKKDVAIMNDIRRDTISIDLESIEDIDFFQYECLGLKDYGISTDNLKQLIINTRNIINASK